jgi:DNA-binding transcriptional MerR regulator
VVTYRALAAGYGPPTAQAIMRAVHAGDVERALTEVDAAHARVHEQRELLRDTGKALEAVAEETPEQVRRTGLHIREVARLLGVRTSALRVWEAAGLLSPGREPGTGYRIYTPADVRDARMIHLLRQSYYPLPQIGPVLEGLRRTGSSAELRAAIARRQAELARRTMDMLAAAGRLHDYLTSGSASS